MGETRMYAIGRAILLVLVAFLKSYHPICADDGPVTGVCVAAEQLWEASHNRSYRQYLRQLRNTAGGLSSMNAA